MNAWLGANEKKLGPREKEREACVTFLEKDSQNKTSKNTINRRMQATMTNKTPRILSSSTALAHVPEVHPEKCGFSA